MQSQNAYWPVAGIQLSSVKAGIKYPDRKDLTLIALAEGTVAAAVFTQNKFRAAPVLIAQAHLEEASPKFLVINTGYANAGTGSQGLAVAKKVCESVAELLGCTPEAVLPFSTGVIGEDLPLEPVVTNIAACARSLDAQGWQDAAVGIMTTDTRPKGASIQFQLGNQLLTITGIAKGAGMICPNMATMLSFIATDAPVEKNCLEQLLREAVAVSFNRITIDGDTSTNDAVVLMATGKADIPLITQHSDPEILQLLRTKLIELCQSLAKSIVRDGEGATKFISIQVSSGASEADCLSVARTIAHSPLVKTALYAQDPNWGRILAAIGRAPVSELDVSKVSFSINGISIVESGQRAAGYREEAMASEMSKTDLEIRVDLGLGDAQDCIWTSDLSHEYVTINADYRS